MKHNSTLIGKKIAVLIALYFRNRLVHFIQALEKFHFRDLWHRI